MYHSDGVGLSSEPVLKAATNFNRAGAKLAHVANLNDQMYAGGDANADSIALWNALRRCFRETYEGYFMLQKGIHDTVHDLLTVDGEVAGNVSTAAPVFKPGEHRADKGGGHGGDGNRDGIPDLPGVGPEGPRPGVLTGVLDGSGSLPDFKYTPRY